MNKEAKGLDCVHEMNTINHYVGMYPIDTGAPVEVPLSKFFFGFFAVMLLGFMATQRKQQLMILGAGFAAVTAWMVADQIVLGHLDVFAAHYYHEASTFFNQPDVLARWVANLKLATKAAMAGLVVAMVIIMLGVWKIRQFSLLLALVPALLPVFFVLDYAGWLWFFGHNMHPWGAFTVKPFMPTVFGEGKVAQFSTYSYPYYGYALLLARVCRAVAGDPDSPQNDARRAEIRAVMLCPSPHRGRILQYDLDLFQTWTDHLTFPLWRLFNEQAVVRVPTAGAGADSSWPDRRAGRQCRYEQCAQAWMWTARADLSRCTSAITRIHGLRSFQSLVDAAPAGSTLKPAAWHLRRAGPSDQAADHRWGRESDHRRRRQGNGLRGAGEWRQRCAACI